MKSRSCIAFVVSILAVCCVGAAQNSTPKSSDDATNSRLFLEYVWNTAGTSFKKETLDETIALWNEHIDAAQYNILGADILTPHFETKDGDLLWVVIWPSLSARKAVWSDWNNNHESAWKSKTSEVLDYNSETITLFEKTSGYPFQGLKKTTFGSNFENTFNLCSFTKNHNQRTFHSFTNKYEDWIDENSHGESKYAYSLLKAQDGFENYDFIWLDFWENAEEKANAQKRFAGTEYEKQWQAMTVCDSFSFSGVRIR